MSLILCSNDVGDTAERISFAKHGKLVPESSEFELMLIRAHKARIFFKLEIRKKKPTISSEKRESGIVLKKTRVYARKWYC